MSHATSTTALQRVFLYSHDSYGLGHVRRTVTIARSLASSQGVTALCATGSPRPDLFPLSPGIDFVKLPSFTKDDSGDYVPRTLQIPREQAIALRGEILRATVMTFRPTLVVVDHAPLGLGGELRASLEWLRGESPATRIVLGCRDVIDSPVRTRAQFSREGIYDALRRYYDDVVVYGHRHIVDFEDSYGLASTGTRVAYAGVVSPHADGAPRYPADSASGHRESGGRTRRLLVSAGGGGDGFRLLRSTIAALRGPLRRDDLEATIVTGPLMRADDRAQLERSARGDARLRVLDATDEMGRLVDSSDLVVSMGGYNSVWEALALERRLFVYPRRQPREEQLVRAHRLASLDLLHTLRSEDLDEPSRLARKIRRGLDQPPPRPARSGISFSGAEWFRQRFVDTRPVRTPGEGVVA